MGDVDISFRINSDTPRMGRNGERAQELALRSEPLHALVAELGGVHLIVLADGDAHAGAELALSLTAASPLQEESRSRHLLIICRGPCSRQQGEPPSINP